MKNWKRFILGCTVGNILEWYDFILYGYFAIVIAHLFFPTYETFYSTILTYVIFTAGCILRPLSSILFGVFGDRFGRRRALIISIILITLATTTIGVLPTYSSIGYIAPILLTICRLFQGVAVSGEEMGAAIFLLENAPQKKRGIAGSLILSSVYLGLFLGSSIILTLANFVTDEIISDWAWRIPFLLAGVFGVIALFIRLRDEESPAFLEMKQNNKINHRPVYTVFRYHWRSLINATLLSSALAVGLYLFVVYMPGYFMSQLHFDFRQTLSVSAVNLLFITMLVPIVGYFSDKISPSRMMLTGCLGMAILGYPIFLLLSSHNVIAACLAETILIICLSFIAGSIMPLLVFSFPQDIRYTGAGFAFNLSMTVFGSTAPLVAIILMKYTQTISSLFYYIFSITLLSLIALLLLSQKINANLKCSEITL